MLDTHAWLWHASAPERLSSRAREALKAADGIGVCTISCWEVGMLVRHGRIALERDLSEWVAGALALERIEPIPLSAEIAVEAALMPDDLPGDPADRIIYATARRLHARLVTKDGALRRFDRAATIW